MMLSRVCTSVAFGSDSRPSPFGPLWRKALTMFRATTSAFVRCPIHPPMPHISFVLPTGRFVGIQRARDKAMNAEVPFRPCTGVFTH